MNHFIKPVLLVLIFGLCINSTYSQKKVELKLNPETGNMAEPDIPQVGNLGGVEWVIKDSQIKSFQIVAKNKKARYIFTKPLPEEQGTRLHMKIKAYFRTKEYKWEYSIVWIDNSNRRRDFDPKIAVKPIQDVFLIPLLGFIITLITSIVYYRKWQKAERQLKKPRQNI